ncbi:MAG: hypothetical protein DRP12_00285 [Candidatus Aenigmatarchaeota archaeon]|nr:MAG: hypothetical protein DRP12_00285 [Candidatus Aenigmarchaeota archaeon]
MEEIIRYEVGKGMVGSVRNKVRAFIENGCVVQVGPKSWIVRPIPGYNKTTYEVTSDGSFFRCSCQYNRTKGLVCSHILAVTEYIKMRRLGYA